MAFLSKYATARHIRVPLIKVGVNNFAVGADWTPAAGDVKISIDGGAAANVTNLPTAIAMGNGAIWDFNLTSGELTGAQIVVTVADSVTKAVEDDAFEIETYGNASAQHVFDLSQATPAVNLTQVKGSAAHATTLDNWLAQDVSGTATSGSTTTLVDAARTEADTDYWKGSILLMTSGNLAGQPRRITAFNAATDTITVSPAFTQAVATQTYTILPDAGTDNIMWNGQLVPVPNVTGVPKVDVIDWLGSPPNVLVAARVDVSVGAMATDVLTSAALAASAVTEIQTGLSTLTTGQVNTEVTNVLTVTTRPEPGQGTPPATASMALKLDYVYKATINKKTQSPSQFSLYNSAGNVIDQKAATSDDGTTFTSGTLVTGP